MPAAEAQRSPVPGDGAAPPREGEREQRSPSLAAHPRAARRVAESKAWGGLAGFALGAYLSLASHTPAEAIFRGLLAGVVCYVAVWAAAVFLWRRLVVAELNEAERALIAGEIERRGGREASAGERGAGSNER